MDKSIKMDALAAYSNERPKELTDSDIEYLKLLCTELTYKEIADAVYIGQRTAESYLNKLLEKLHVKSRAGLVRYALKKGIVKGL